MFLISVGVNDGRGRYVSAACLLRGGSGTAGGHTLCCISPVISRQLRHSCDRRVNSLITIRFSSSAHRVAFMCRRRVVDSELTDAQWSLVTSHGTYKHATPLPPPPWSQHLNTHIFMSNFYINYVEVGHEDDFSNKITIVKNVCPCQ